MPNCPSQAASPACHPQRGQICLKTHRKWRVSKQHPSEDSHKPSCPHNLSCPFLSPSTENIFSSLSAQNWPSQCRSWQDKVREAWSQHPLMVHFLYLFFLGQSYLGYSTAVLSRGYRILTNSGIVKQSPVFSCTYCRTGQKYHSDVVQQKSTLVSKSKVLQDCADFIKCCMEQKSTSIILIVLVKINNKMHY